MLRSVPCLLEIIYTAILLATVQIFVHPVANYSSSSDLCHVVHFEDFHAVVPLRSNPSNLGQDCT